MLQSAGVLRRTTVLINEAVRKTCSDLDTRRLEQEPEFTAALLTRISDALDGKLIRGLTWSAKVLTSSGPGSQEHVIGADFAGLLNIELRGYRVAKGFLAQAKLVEDIWTISTTEFNRARVQCERMLQHSHASFLFVYNRDGVRVIPATAIVSLTKYGDLGDLYNRSISSFLQLHLESFVGDLSINATDMARLLRVLAKAEVSKALVLKLQGPDQKESGTY